MTKYGRSKNHGEEDSSFAVFRLHVPRANLTTTAERTGARLVNLWERNKKGGLVLQNSFIPYLPARLSRSACLRDCTALFCSAWNEYHRGKPVETLLDTPLYGKALRSLQQAFQGADVYTVETLGAMVLLERTYTTFGNLTPGSIKGHHRAIEAVLTKKPPLNFDDDLEVALAFENSNILHSASLSGSSNYISDDRWRDLLTKVTLDSMAEEEMKPFAEDSLYTVDLLNTLIESAHSIFQIRANPQETQDLKEMLSRKLRAHATKMESMCLECTTKALDMGSLREVPDESSITGLRFESNTVQFAHVYAGFLNFQIVLCRMVYELEVIDGNAGEAEYTAYKAGCTQLWNFVPYISRVDTVAALHMIGAILPTLEAANDMELEYIVDECYKADKYSKRLPKDRETFIAKSIWLAKSRTGRL
ncbi:unnamed protein product [Clonostachys rosea]|uniref:Uncharacterized protein n=1 Tax=Bionectria ochroleuca TaxID=29856 RepID=A0ABY6TPV1_BIOOC|nr:unnamed protein product [Clonostachys rosea]